MNLNNIMKIEVKKMTFSMNSEEVSRKITNLKRMLHEECGVLALTIETMHTHKYTVKMTLQLNVHSLG